MEERKQKKHFIGIMQGRLIDSPDGQLDWFPQNNWKDEFTLSNKIGIDYIELVAEKNHNNKNPIWSKDGRLKISQLIKKNQLKEPYMCFNYMMNNSILNKNTLKYFNNLLYVCTELKIKNIVLPFFEESIIQDFYFGIIIERIKLMSREALKEKISLILETSISGNKMFKFINDIEMENVGILIDSGNYYEFGFDIVKDLYLFKNLVTHIHIKDKDDKGNNVILGNGGVNFDLFFNALKNINYKTNFTFETTRGNNAIKNAEYNINFFNKFFKNN